MARDSDRKQISEAIRMANRAGNRVWSPSWASLSELTVTSFPDGTELNITYSKAGQIVHVAHWQPVPGTDCASRQPITERKRKNVLDIISSNGKATV